MELSTTQQILLIILSSTLAILLILAITAAVLVIRLLITLKMIAGKAEKVVESAEAVGEMLKRTAGPLGMIRFAKAVFDTVIEHRKSNK